MAEIRKIFPICREPYLSNISIIFQKGADNINAVSRLRKSNFTVAPEPEMHAQVSCRKNCTKTSGVPGDTLRNKNPDFVAWNINRIDLFEGVYFQERNKFSV